jgi:Ras-related protein Rab-1A
MNGRKKPIIIVAPKNSERLVVNVGSQDISPSHYDDYDYLFKFAIVGDSGVGKSCLLLRYADDYYTDSQISTIGVDFKMQTLNVAGKTIKTQVWDIASRVMHADKYRGVHAVIVAFDLTNKASFNRAKVFIEQCDRYTKANIVLVGTKFDLDNKRAVAREEIEEFIKDSSCNADVYIETSAKTGENVQLAFEAAAKLILDRVSLSKRNESPLNNGIDPRKLLIADLSKYITRIESHKNPKASNKPDFSYGFWHHKNSRAVNREANYYLAKDLLNKLQYSLESIESIFNDTDGQRDTIIANHNLYTRIDYKNRGINSDELNAIINNARRHTSSKDRPSSRKNSKK